RRKFERVDVAHNAQVLVLDSKGKKVGVLRQIGRGGFMMEPDKSFSKDGKLHKLTLHEPQEDIRPQVTVRALYADPRVVGFEFVREVRVGGWSAEFHLARAGLCLACRNRDV